MIIIDHQDDIYGKQIVCVKNKSSIQIVKYEVCLSLNGNFILLRRWMQAVFFFFFCNTLTSKNHRPLHKTHKFWYLCMLFYMCGSIHFKNVTLIPINYRYFILLFFFQNTCAAKYNTSMDIICFARKLHRRKLFCNRIVFGCTFSSSYEGFYQKNYISHGNPLLDLHESARNTV